MKRIASFILLALLVGSLCASAAHATVSRGANCMQCHPFANQPPVANAGADQTVTAGARVTLSGVASSDADDGIASYAWTQTVGTTLTLTNANTVSASFTAPSVTAQTVLTFQLTVRDRLPQTSTDTVAITVRPAGTPLPNQVPVANAGADLTAVSGAQAALNGSLSSDPDDGIASYAWSQTGSPVVTLSSPAVAMPTFTAPQVTATATLTFTLRVTDRSGLSATDTCLVMVNPPGSPNNKLPVANAGVDMMVLPGTFHNLDGFYSNDPDGAIVSYAWQQTSGPAVTLSDPTAMNPVFQAPSSPTTLTFQVTVTDKGGAKSSDTCTVVVLSADGGIPTDTTAPTISLTSPAGGTTVSGSITLRATATDNVGVTKVEFYSGATLLGTGTNSSGSTWQYSWNTASAANGSSSLTAKAYDAAGNSRTSSAVTVTVSNVIRDTTPPTISLTSPTGGTTVSGAITISATATDNVGVTKVEFYSGATLLGTGTNSSGSTWQYSWNTAGVANGSSSLTAKAYDAAGNSKTSSAVSVTVANTTPPSTNQPPVAKAGRDQTVRAGATVRLSGSGSTDPDNGIASYQWRQISGTSLRLTGSSSVRASFVAPRVSSRSVTLTFQLTVRDKAGLSSSDTVRVTVSRSGDDDDDD